MKLKHLIDLDLEAGQYKLNWDFTDDQGNKVPVGDYRVEINATGQSITDMEVAQYFVGVIDGVRYSPNGTSIVVNDLEYKVSDVFEVVEAKDNVSNEEPDPILEDESTET